MIAGYTFTPGEVVTPEKLNDLVADAEIEDRSVTSEKYSGNITLIDKTGNFTIALDERGKTFICNSASTITVTVPTDGSVDFPLGSYLVFYRMGAGDVVFSPAVGVTLESFSSRRKINSRFLAVGLLKRAANAWTLLGNLKT